MAARTPFKRALRDFVMSGLAVWAIPPTYWRDVLLLVGAELAVKELRGGDYAAMEVLTGPKKLVSVPGITHFEMYINEPFEISSNTAADWFREHLGLLPKGDSK